MILDRKTDSFMIESVLRGVFQSDASEHALFRITKQDSTAT